MFSWEGGASSCVVTSLSCVSTIEEAGFDLGLVTVFSPKPWPDAARDHDGGHRASGICGDGVKADIGEMASDAAIAAAREMETMVKVELGEERGEELRAERRWMGCGWQLVDG